jgi:two-component system OmpR family sensor kinase
MFRSLNSRLLLSYVAVIVVCLVLVGLGLLLFAGSLWTRETFWRLEAAAQATLLALRQAGPLETLPPERLRAQVLKAAEEQEVRVLVLDARRTVQFDSEKAWEGERLELDGVARTPVALGRVRGAFLAPTGRGGGRWIFAGQMVARPGGGRQIILFASPRWRMWGWFVENLVPPLVRAGAVAFVLSILLALLVSRSVAAPLRRVAAAAEAIARGEAGTRAPVSGPQEVRALASSFNTMADRVEAARQSQRDFVANVSHELKTPLTSIQGFSQALLDGTASTPETAARAAHVVHEEAERMRRMVDELLTLARFDAGQMVMARDPVELGPLLRACVEKLAPQAQAAEVTIDMDVPEQLPVTGDADRLAQVFGNLLDNGVAHTPAGGSVAVAARRADEGHFVEVTVTDTGRGIPADALPRIFERFYQVDKARRRSRGAGLGLAITKEIVEAHGGTITAESVVGLGSRFAVRLPRWEGKPTAAMGRQGKQ